MSAEAGNLPGLEKIVSPAGAYFAIRAKGSHSIYLFPPELEAVASQVLLLKESWKKQKLPFDLE